MSFVDSTAIKRFIYKCGVIENKKMIVSIIRRFDLNANAKLGINEFFNAIFTLEKFTKTSLEELKKQQAKK
jgi:hypothetical protein